MSIPAKLLEIESAIEDSYDAVDAKGGTLPQKRSLNNLSNAIGSINKGVPEGGTTGQILTKKSDTDYDTEWSNQQDISGKADKDLNATEGNLAEFDSSGNPVDSGIDADALMSKIGNIDWQEETQNPNIIPSIEKDGADVVLEKMTGASLSNKVVENLSEDNFNDIFAGFPINQLSQLIGSIPTGDSLVFINVVDSAPSSSSDSGERGQVYLDTDYIYVCVADDTWRRVAISTF